MISVKPYGKTKYGEEARLFTLEGKGGVRMDVTDWGGRVVRLYTPDRNGELKDVTIGFDDPSGYENTDRYWAALIGRVGNRIAAGKFSLDGKDYSLALNNFPAGIGCHLHGGERGWDSYIWGVEPFEKGDDVGLILTHTSPDGDEGYDGTVKVKVVYTLTKDNVWRVEYEAVTDKATPINMTQHIYFNFKGEAGGTIEDHILQIESDVTTPYGPDQIPTGEFRAVEGTPFDFRKPTEIGLHIHDDDDQIRYGKGYDHNWILRNQSGRLERAATLVEPKCGRRLEVWTTEPALQVYTANWCQNGWKAKGTDVLCERCGIALETQHTPDAVNKPNFASIILRPGETYRTTTEFRFSVV